MKDDAIRILRLLLAVFALTTSASILHADPDPVANIVSGSVADINHTTHVMGRAFRVQFKEIKYGGTLKSVEVLDDASIQADVSVQTIVQVRLSDVKLMINRTSVQGARQHASCGPIEMKLGTIRDLVVEFEVKRNKDAELTLVDSKLKLDSDNLQIGSPRWVQAQGIGMNNSNVANGLRSGLNSNLPLLKRLLSAELPNVFRQIEDQIEGKVSAIEVANVAELSTP
ncbi:hypothetical protein NZK35_09750 [Stieleria sp. ICT_E10.1]|uniref:hypothetical protein n=1 Tax=Stieleria sedimenti TaxID=2976331 RepID=UPI00217F4C5E|nr:hypothetical protein [Stieleria sedimenti]MCS7466928.1 hypothetical protein [Stieleria sedimenti]